MNVFQNSNSVTDATALAPWCHLCHPIGSAAIHERRTKPLRNWPGLDGILALHRHPEFEPLVTVEDRLRQLYPTAHEWLLVPNQHSQLAGSGSFHGVEVD